jgi:hypothetical protein
MYTASAAMTLYYAINKARSKTFGQPSVNVEFPLHHFPPHPYMFVFKFKDVQGCIAGQYIVHPSSFARIVATAQSWPSTTPSADLAISFRAEGSLVLHTIPASAASLIFHAVSSFLACRVAPLQVDSLPLAPLYPIQLPSFFQLSCPVHLPCRLYVVEPQALSYNAQV